MGLSGGGSSRSGSAQKWAAPLAKNAAGNVQDVFNQNQPQLQQITKGVTSLLPGISQNYQSWAPLTDKAQGYYGDVLSGKYLDPSNNPALSGVLDRTRRDVTGSVNSNWAGAGRYSSFGHGEALTRGLADAENSVLYDAYNRERGIQDNAATMPAQMENQNLAQLLQASGIGAELPYAGTNSLASALSALFGGGVQKGPGLGSQLLSAGAQVGSAALMASDRRLKENIEKVGEFDDGLGLYEFDYIDAPSQAHAAYMPAGRQRGVMADEVAELRPWALGPEIAGFATVDYARL